jgi:triosephosphate isomerase
MKRIIVAGNWKMNKTYLEAKEFIAKLNQKPAFQSEVIIGVPSVYADTLYINNQKDNVHIILQNCSHYEMGAYTGEISAKMIASLNMKYCIVGHSERRTFFGETDEIIAQKLKQLMNNAIQPIFCIGETLEDREQNKTFDVIQRQLEMGLHGVSTAQIQSVCIAYEPVWAIGTGKTATKEQAQDAHRFIFDYLVKQYGEPCAATIPILYGGSCNEHNAEELFSQPNIWGGLIGNASLNMDSFYKIISIAENMNYVN